MASSHHHRPAPDEQQLIADHARMIRRWLWRDFLIVILGAWLLAAPATLGYLQSSPPLALSDLLCGAALMLLGLLTTAPRFDLLRWATCALGLWLLAAPLIFWTPDPAAYNNDTLVGALAITFSVLLPMMPSRAHHRVMSTPGPEIPPGWSYNPSDWFQRGPIIAVALLGFFLSRYLAAYQLGHTAWPWDPLFGDGTQRVLDSQVSRAWPISDAGLGAVSYLIEALSGFMGGVNRWRTMPWMVALFGVLVVPLGVVSIVLVILQPVAVGAWCALCLVTAAAMLIMIAPAIDEVVASVQFLLAARREGQPLWRTFWVGGALERAAPSPLPTTPEPHRSPATRIFEAFDLNNVPLTLPLAAALGLWLMTAPDVLGATGPAADSDHLTGALIVTWSVIAFGEIARPVRFLNIPTGLWLIAAPWLLTGDSDASAWNNLALGPAVILLSLRRGHIQQRFATWNRYLV